MDVIVVFNGLGNQMSQYAFYLAKKERNKKCHLIFDPKSANRHNGSELDKLFGVRYSHTLKFKIILLLYTLFTSSRIGKYLSPFLGIRFYYEPRNYHYSEQFLMPGKGLLNFYIGGWHSEKYFRNIRSTILNKIIFDTTEEHDSRFLELVDFLKLNNNVIVSLHVRRGDYLLSKPNDFYQYGGIATLSYYNKAITFFNNKIKDAKYLVFSNDIEWCKEHFNKSNFIFVTCNSGSKSWRDLYLMSLCRYHIVANSTFSWWGAWLSNYRETFTICPERFLASTETLDFYPETWLKIASN